MVVNRLLVASEKSREVSLDEIGEALGTLSASYSEIDAMIAVLESKHRRVSAPAGGSGEAHLARVVSAAKTLSADLGRRPNVAEIASLAGLSVEQVKHALVLARIMQR
jgi:hypothetical protein